MAQQDCPEIQTEAVKRGLVLSSLERTNGSEINITCAEADRQLEGTSLLQCLNGQWSSELPTCSGGDDLTEREILIVAIAGSIMGVIVLVLLGVAIWMMCIKKRQRNIRSQRLQTRLESLSIRDPLEELVRRESQRGTTNQGYTTSFSNSDLGGNKILYKIWNYSRTNKQFAFAASLTELFEKAMEKLDVTDPLRIVLESDGTEITSDQILLACNGCVFLVLQQGEEWTPAPSEGGESRGGVEGSDSGVGVGESGGGGLNEAYDLSDGDRL